MITETSSLTLTEFAADAADAIDQQATEDELQDLLVGMRDAFMKAKQLEAAAIVPPTPGWYIPDARFKNKFPPRQVLAVGNGLGLIYMAP